MNAERARRERHRLGLTQVELEAREFELPSGKAETVSLATIKRAERGEPISPRSAAQLELALGLRLGTLSLTTASEERREAQAVPPELPGLIVPLDFRLELEKLTEQFAGRSAALAELRDWADLAESRTLVLLGDPGIGKSALLARYAATQPHVLAVHFCSRGLRDTIDPHRFVLSIAAQLASQIPWYRSLIRTVDDAWLAATSSGTLLRRLLLDPLHRGERDEPCVLIVDGLDEAEAGPDGLAALFTHSIRDFPAWCRVVTSTRRDDIVLDRLSGLEVRLLASDEAEQVSAIQRWVST